ncbi:MAG: hypothetical protein B6D59_03475 [Campylobacteraceae bacterium 4484_4]|nr:MAG: hypothetical protein B6D59_03475 [Campylobacteraceae bacterium 4484_4]
MTRLEKIARELEFDIEDVQMLLSMFNENAQESLTQISTAIMHHDLPTIQNAAHAIKGSAANLTLSEISEKAKEIEVSAKAGEERDYLELYQQLQSLIEEMDYDTLCA